MYFKVFEFELAKQYILSFLNVNEYSPEGRRLLGHCYDKLGNKDKAVAEYQKSLASTPNQPELLLSCKYFKYKYLICYNVKVFTIYIYNFFFRLQVND